ncbi:hypothetical protein CRG98_025476 [Punica granatum]|uniref:Secreted protein n=1 Tax=Punica granatum TaxID=22663 RepID=A0A2I0JCZ6_PUNGR|nr:hypothetical protein CRG98_025476 [Punica granatum]
MDRLLLFLLSTLSLLPLRRSLLRQTPYRLTRRRPAGDRPFASCNTFAFSKRYFSLPPVLPIIYQEHRRALTRRGRRYGRAGTSKCGFSLLHFRDG